MPSMMMPLILSSFLLSLLISIALLPNGSNAMKKLGENINDSQQKFENHQDYESNNFSQSGSSGDFSDFQAHSIVGRPGSIFLQFPNVNDPSELFASNHHSPAINDDETVKSSKIQSMKSSSLNISAGSSGGNSSIDTKEKGTKKGKFVDEKGGQQQQKKGSQSQNHHYLLGRKANPQKDKKKASDTVELHHHGHSAVSSHKNNGANAKDKN